MLAKQSPASANVLFLARTTSLMIEIKTKPQNYLEKSAMEQRQWFDVSAATLQEMQSDLAKSKVQI